jgi:nitroreductase
MDVETAVKERRSIRSFKTDPVPQETLREILEAARWSPSWGNTQPWELYVVTGEALAQFKEKNRQKCLDGETPSCEIPMPEAWPDVLKRRYVDVGKSVLTSMSIARGDVEGRNRYYGEMFSLFDAPAMILICLGRDLSMEYAMLDVGLIVQTICLLAHERGVGTCILAASVNHPQVLRDLLPIPEDQVIVIGMAMGYPDDASPVNHFERRRAELNEWVTWID